MPKLLNIEEKENGLPLLCLFGEGPLVERIVNENTKKFRIILISQKKPAFLDSFPEVYFVALSNLELLPKLEETISYSVVFLENLSNPQDITPLTEKLRLDKAQTLLISKVHNLLEHKDLIEKYKENKEFKFALIGEVLLLNDGDFGVSLSKIIEKAIVNGEVSLEGKDLQSVFAISEIDVLLCINRLLFGNFKNDTIYYLFYRKPETLLDAAHIIGRVEPDTKIHFSGTTIQPDGLTRGELKNFITNSLKKNTSYLEPAAGNFEKSLELFFDDREKIIENIKKTIDGKKVKVKKEKRKVFSTLKFVILSILFGTFLFLFINLLFFGLGLFFLRNALSEINKNNFSNVANNARVSNFFLSTIKPTINLTFDLIELIDSNGTLQKTYALAERSRELSEISGLTVNSIFDGNNLSKGKTASALSNLSYIYLEGQRIVLETGNKSISSQLKSTYAKLLSLSSIIQDILGFDREKNYLLLFQNSDELRPTGGFIGSVGDLIVKNGRVERISIQDVYEIDGQLRKHIDPPFVVRRYLQPHLYLRDSNFSLNFQETSSTSATIYNLVTNKRPDAVIALDLHVLREILKTTGPIKLTSYNATVTDETISDFIQNTIKDNFFPGSTQKKDILNAVMTQLIERSKTDPAFYISIAKLLPDLLEQKHILISFNNDSIQRIFSANGYSGEPSDTRPNGSKNINDYLYINEANIGINKVNKDVSRTISYQALVGSGKLSSVATLKLLNNSKDLDYTAYLTAAVPKGSNVRRIEIAGVEQSLIPAVTDPKIFEDKNFEKPEGLEVEQYGKDKFTYISFVVTAPKNSETKIDIEYDNGAGKNLSTIVNYSFLYIKQPGTLPYKLDVTVDYPEDYLPVDTSAESYGKNYLKIEKDISTDFVTEVELRKRKL